MLYKLTQFFCRHTKNFHSDIIQHICEVPGCARVFENYDRRAAHYREDHDYRTEVKPILEALRNIRAAARQQNRVQRPALRIDRQRFERFGSENIVYRNPQPENIKLMAFIHRIKNTLLNRWKMFFEQNLTFTVQMHLNVDYIHMHTDSRGDLQMTEKPDQYLHVREKTIYTARDIVTKFEESVEELNNSIVSHTMEESGWRFARLNYLRTDIIKYNPIMIGDGRHHYENGLKLALPERIIRKKCITDVHSQEQDCFKWSILAGVRQIEMIKLHGEDANYNKGVTSIMMKKKELYEPYNEYVDWTGVDFPTKLDDIEVFEENNPDYAVSVLGLRAAEEDEMIGPVSKEKKYYLKMQAKAKKEELVNKIKKSNNNDDADDDDEDILNNAEPAEPKKSIPIHPLYISSKLADENRKQINLLMLYKGEKLDGRYHFTYINNINSLTKENSTNRNPREFCINCFNYFYGKDRKERYKNHLPQCLTNKPRDIKLPTKNPILKFNSYKQAQKYPFILIGDTESTLHTINKSDNDDDDNGESVYLDNCIRSDNEEEEDEEEKEEDDLPMYSAPGPTHTWTKGKKQQPSVMRTREILDKFSRNVEQEHKLLSYAFIVKAPTQELQNKFDPIYTGSGVGCLTKFISDIKRVKKKIKNLWKEYSNAKMNTLTCQENEQYEAAENCYICDKKITCKLSVPDWTAARQNYKDVQKSIRLGKRKAGSDKTIASSTVSLPPIVDSNGPKVRDHDHFTGTYRGAAHATCNLTMRLNKEIPFFFHNGGKYDFKHLLEGLANPENRLGRPSVIAKSKENFLCIRVGRLCFKDSFNHLSTSLEKLIETLKSKAKKQAQSSGESLLDCYKRLFPSMWSYYDLKYSEKLGGSEKFHTILEKGIFPYRYMTSEKVFQDTKLPEKKYFNDDLKNQKISKQDYKKAKRVWKQFQLNNLGEYHDLYLARDVFLLADVFENYRNISLKTYGLDPAGFLTAPALSWACGLKFTKVELDLLCDKEMIDFMDSALVGGYSAVVHPYSKANTPAMGKKFDKTKPRTDLILLDW